MQVSASLTGVGTTSALPVESYGTGDRPLGVMLDFTTVAAVGTVSLEVTFDNVFDSTVTPVWLPHSDFTAKTTTFVKEMFMPARAVRLNCTAYTSGTITLRLLQRGGG